MQTNTKSGFKSFIGTTQIEVLSTGAKIAIGFGLGMLTVWAWRKYYLKK